MSGCVKFIKIDSGNYGSDSNSDQLLGEIPVPLMVAALRSPPALLLTWTSPVRLPAASGVKAIEMTQVLLGATEFPEQGSAVMENSFPLVEMIFPREIARLVMFLICMAWALLALLTV